LKEKQNRKGPVVTYAPAVQNNLRELILDTAEEKKFLPAFGFFKSYRHGCILQQWWCGSALISPLRYMHTTVEMVHRDDVENVIKLIYETILKLENNETFSYFK
jgi:putative aminopeptidase FrvX